MNINCTTHMDLKALKAYNNILYSSKISHKMMIIILILLWILQLIQILSFDANFFYFALAVIITGVISYRCFLQPRLVYKKIKNEGKERTISYCFEEETFKYIYDKSENVLQYDQINKIREATDWIVIYMKGDMGNFLVDKSSVEECHWREFRSKMISILGKHYEICSY